MNRTNFDIVWSGSRNDVVIRYGSALREPGEEKNVKKYEKYVVVGKKWWSPLINFTSEPRAAESRVNRPRRKYPPFNYDHNIIWYDVSRENRVLQKEIRLGSYLDEGNINSSWYSNYACWRRSEKYIEMK